jgi:outer membrane protein assembly factor BamB
MVAPLATPESIVWTTDAGYLYVGNSQEPGMRFRLETGSEIVAPPAYRKPFVYVGATSGELFAMHELTGARRWKYTTGFPVTRAAAAVGKRVFITSEEPALHCIDAESGDMVWQAPGMVQFAAVSKARVYGINDLGAFVVLDAASGNQLGRIITDHEIHALVNDQTDRVYLVSDSGMIECLHELGSEEPLYHVPKAAEDGKPVAADGQPPEAAPVQPPAVAPPAAAEPAAEPAEAPPQPADEFGVEENPFGG